jgi:hypothetical protein
VSPEHLKGDQADAALRQYSGPATIYDCDGELFATVDLVFDDGW